jgi:hypothetical protein
VLCCTYTTYVKVHGKNELCDKEGCSQSSVIIRGSTWKIEANMMCMPLWYVPFVLCASTSFTQLPAIKTIGKGRFGFGALSAGYSFFLVSKLFVRSLER